MVHALVVEGEGEGKVFASILVPPPLWLSMSASTKVVATSVAAATTWFDDAFFASATVTCLSFTREAR